MNSVHLTKELASQVRPLAGRVVLRVPPLPKHTELLHLPDSAGDHRITDTHQKAYVLKIGYGPFYEDGVQYPGVTEFDLIPGDWVVFRPLLQELNQRYILTDVRRIDARIVRNGSKHP